MEKKIRCPYCGNLATDWSWFKNWIGCEVCGNGYHDNGHFYNPDPKENPVNPFRAGMNFGRVE